MDAKVVEFTALLRRNGVRVSLAETMDAFQALDAVGLGDRDTVRAALRATAVKRAVDVPTFDRLFDLYFSGLGAVIREATAATQAAIGLDEEDFARFLAQLEQLLAEQGIELSPLAQALLRADGGRLEQRLRDECQMPCQLAESPLTCVAVGSGLSLEEFEAIHRASKNSGSKQYR